MHSSPTTQVYIVDDSSEIRMRLAALIERVPGTNVGGQAACASDAIAGIRESGPDCVLLDLNLIGGSGLEVLRTIHKEAPGIVFIVLTNHAEPQYRNACMKAGAAHFLDKSTEFDRVAELICALSRTH